MTTIASMLARIPRAVLFAAAAVIQIALVAMMVTDRMGILREGTEVVLQTRPVDPRDFLRGDYVTLFYEISSMQAGALTNTPIKGRGTPIYVKLAPGADGVHHPVSMHLEPVAVSGKDVLITGRLSSGRHCGGRTGDRRLCERLNITYGIERYFVPEGEGLAIESARNQGKVNIVVAVTPAGRAAIKRLLIDGKSVYDEPMF